MAAIFLLFIIFSRVMFAIAFQQVGKIQGSVLLGRTQPAVAQKFLDDSEVGPTLEEVGGEGMAKQVRIDRTIGTGDFPESIDQDSFDRTRSQA